MSLPYVLLPMLRRQVQRLRTGERPHREERWEILRYTQDDNRFAEDDNRRRPRRPSPSPAVSRRLPLSERSES